MDVLCIICGAVVSQVAGKKVKEYCSSKCKQKAYRLKGKQDDSLPAVDKPANIPVAEVISTVKHSGSMPLRGKHEHSVDYAFRKNEWKRLHV